MNLHFHKEEPLYSFDIFELGPKKVYPSLFEYYWSLKENHTEDYVKANEFFIDLCKKFTMYNDTEIDISVPSREHIKNFGFFLDTYMNGCHWGELNKDYNLHSRIINSDCAKLANLLQLHSLKRKTAEKYKLSKRQQLEYEFDKWDIDKQFRLVKTIIKASCCDEDDFPEYFSNSNNSFERLIKTIRS